MRSVVNCLPHKALHMVIGVTYHGLVPPLIFISLSRDNGHQFCSVCSEMWGSLQLLRIIILLQL